MTEVDALGAWVPTETDDIKDSELWSLDVTLTNYILPRIRAFRNMKRQGYPVLGKALRGVAHSSSAEDERAEAEWENILFDIEKGFEAHKNFLDGKFLTTAEDIEAEGTIQKGLQLFAEHYNHLWD
mgnify:CR=1 FL=1